MRDEVDHLSSVRGTLCVEMKKARRELTGAPAEVGRLMGQVTTHKRFAKEPERRASNVQYYLDGARAGLLS